MKGSFILSCESTIDMPYSYCEEREIPVLFYKYLIDGKEYEDDMERVPGATHEFYEKLRSGAVSKTTQINQVQYMDYFDGLLKEGDVLHVTLGTGITGSYLNARAAAEEMQEKYPERKLLVLDSLCASTGVGLLVDALADMRDKGCSIEEVYSWGAENRNKVHHEFISTDLTFFKRSGRVSGPAAAIATVLNICPTFRINNEGKIIAYEKVRGKKEALKHSVKEMLMHAQGGANYSGKCFVNSADDPEMAELLKKMLEEAFPNIDGGVKVYSIGPIVGSHTGPGTDSVFFFGCERE